MTASPSFCVLDGDSGTATVPRNPTVTDLGGDTFEDDTVYPPAPEQQVVASNIVQINQVMARLAPMIAKASIWVTRADSSYSKVSLTTACPNLVIGNVTVTSDGTYGLIVRTPINSLPTTSIMFDLSFIQLLLTDAGDVQLQDVTTALAQWTDATYAYYGVRFFSDSTIEHHTISAKFTIYGEGSLS